MNKNIDLEIKYTQKTINNNIYKFRQNYTYNFITVNTLLLERYGPLSTFESPDVLNRSH